MPSLLLANKAEDGHSPENGLSIGDKQVLSGLGSLKLAGWCSIAFSGTYAVYRLIRALRRDLKRRREYETLRDPLDYERHAKEYGNPLGLLYYGYVSHTGETLRACREAFARIKLMPRSMQGVDSDPSTEYFGRKVAMPLIIAPTALHALSNPEGEVGTARGAGAAGVVYCYNYMLSSMPIEKVAEQPGEKWLHLYLFEERYMVENALEDALENFKGVFSAVIVTLDHPGNRVRDTVLPHFRRLWYQSVGSLSAPYMPNLSRASGLERAPTTYEVLANPDVTKTIKGNNDSTLQWKDLAWLKEKIRGRVPLIGKGVLDPRDAIAAVQAGADAVVVSNHGGRQCDGAISAVEALPQVIAALKETHPSVKVFCDTGVRTSVDVVRIMALGGAGALIGRPPLYALMCGGSSALEKMLVQWRYDLKEDMKCLGWERWDEKPEGLIVKSSS